MLKKIVLALTLFGASFAALAQLPPHITRGPVYDAANVSITGGAVKATNLTQAKTAPAIAAGVLTLDLSTSNVFVVSLNANITTMTVSNCAATGTLQSWMLVTAADGTPRTIAWATGTKWINPGEVAPTPSSTSGKADAYTAFSYDGCTTIYTNPVAIGYTL